MGKMVFNGKIKDENNNKEAFTISVKEAKYLKRNKNYKKILTYSIILNILFLVKNFI